MIVCKDLHLFLVGSFSLPIFVLNLWLRNCIATFEDLIWDTRWWASPPDIDLDHLSDEYNLPLGDTGKWIFEEVGYREWQESSDSKLLWLCGSPGIGKTMLAKRVAAKILRRLEDPSPGVKLAFHFISPELPSDTNSAGEHELWQPKLAKVASGLLYSILQQDSSLFDGCKAELENQGDRFFTNTDSLWETLRKAIQDCQADPVYILIDGVDRLGGRLQEELIGRILGFMEISKVKIFLSCRDGPYISDSLLCSLPKCTKINLDMNNSVTRDVKTFIRGKVSSWGWDVDLSERAIEALLAKSEGTFLWVSLAIENLSCFSSGPDFNTFLEKPPPELRDIYRLMFCSLSEWGGWEKVLDIIRIVALSLRPLTLGEFAYVLAWGEEMVRPEQPSHPGTSSEIRPRTEEETRMYLRASMGFLRATNTTVSIVHHTAIEYLFGENSAGGHLALPKSEVDLKVSWECFRYLHHVFGDPERFPKETARGHYNVSSDRILGRDPQEGPGETPWEVARKRPQEAATKWPFLRYAAESWFIHARRSIEISKDNFCDDSAHNWLKYQFFETSDIIRNPWVELSGDSRMKALAGEQTSLHIAACLGLMPLVEKALSDFTKETNRNWSLLHPTAKFRSKAYEILTAKSKVSLLKDQGQKGNTPPHEAAISSHLSMLEAPVQKLAELVAYSNKIDKKNNSGNTPLHLASQFGHMEIVDFLVKKGADQTIKNGTRVTAAELGAKLRIGDNSEEAEKGTAEGPVVGSGPRLWKRFRRS